MKDDNYIKDKLYMSCIDLVNSPSILDVLEQQLRAQGFSGATDLPKLVFLTAITRFFDEPVSLVAMGPSGAGKTYAIESGLQFIPPAAIESVSGMSDKALLYASGLNLKHRILYLGEASGLAEGNGRTFLRQLLTEGKLNYLTVQKTTEGMKGERLDTIEGPLSFMMATTAHQIHHEDQTRMLVVNLNEDTARVRQALLNQAKGKSKREVPIDSASWHALHELIGISNLETYIPFAERLAEHMPIEHFRVQRDFPKVLALLRAHTLLHQFARAKDERGRVVATEADYAGVFPLLKAPLDHGLEHALPEGVREVILGVCALTENGSGSRLSEGVSQSAVAEHIGRDRSVVSRNVYPATSQGYLENLNPGRGREARLIPGDRKLPSGSVLPEPERLFRSQAKAPQNLPW